MKMTYDKTRIPGHANVEYPRGNSWWSADHPTIGELRDAVEHARRLGPVASVSIETEGGALEIPVGVERGGVYRDQINWRKLASLCEEVAG